MRAVALEEVIPAALAGLSQAERVDSDVPETLPRVQADAALLERAVANVIENALEVVTVRHARARRSVRRGRSRRLARRRPWFRDRTIASASRCSSRSNGSATASNEHRRRTRPRRRARVRRGDGRHDRGRRHAGRRCHHRHPSRPGAVVTRVLVVDDEPQILRALGINLRARGYDVDLAPDGEQRARPRGAPPS